VRTRRRDRFTGVAGFAAGRDRVRRGAD